MLADLQGTEDAMLREGRARSGAEVLAWWRAERERVLNALRTRDPADRIPWITGRMSAVSFTTARLMETWAHGQDVVDASARRPLPTTRLRHVADLGVRTRPFSYAVNGLASRTRRTRRARGPDGDTWRWGESATDVVRGDALDFCLVVTKRRRPGTTRRST